ncbi:MAG: S41 family peptidase [Bacteroidota bacterium]
MKSIFLFALLLWMCVLHVRAQSSHPSASQVQEVITLVEQHFYDSAWVASPQWKAAAHHLLSEAESITQPEDLAIRLNDLLETLRTSHTRYFSATDPKRFQLLGVFQALYEPERKDLFVYAGIGIDTRMVDGAMAVVSVFDGFPAAEAGLRFGDLILAVDGERFRPNVSFVGKAGQKVQLLIERAGKEVAFEVEVGELDGRTMFEEAARASVRIIEQDSQRIGYLHLWSYAGPQYQALLREELLWGRLSQCDALVLDLRDGWGGADLNYLNLFRPPIATTTYQGRDGAVGSYSGVWKKPVALLVNARSTSGKELFTYGFKKLGLGPVIGEQSAGAVMAGRLFLLSNGAILYLAVRDVAVDGMRLEGIGVAPDISVERSLETPASGDIQLERAVRELVRYRK